VRDGGKVETGYFGINIHRGSDTTTSSLGCQTVPPKQEQWNSFRQLVKSEMKRFGVKKFQYVVVE
jgi:lysozyme